MPDPADLIAAALARRAHLADAGLCCYRLVHGYGEGIDGLTIDRYGDAAVVRYRSDLEPLLAAVCAALPSSYALVTARPRTLGAPPRALRGALPAERVVATEGPHSFLIDYRRGGNPGLYLDARPARAWLRAHAAERRILNLFAFTGSLGIAAAAGGAHSVIHVDNHGPTLAWAKLNWAQNGLRVDDRDFARSDVTAYLRKCRARFGGIVLDPPPGPDRAASRPGIAELAPLAANLLAPGGWLLCFFHHDPRPHADIEAEVATTCGLEPLWRGTAGEDFPEVDHTARLRLTAFARP